MDPIVALLQTLAPAVPRDMTVVVLCDRGLTSPKLWRQILAPGWHPYLRYPKSITCCAENGQRLPARAFVPRPDTAWIGTGTAFGNAAAKRRYTLLAVWCAQQQEPWIILTDLPPEAVGVSWYALRFWIELGFQAIQSLGWQWQQTRRTNPARISRHWFVLSVATLLTLAYGTRVEDAHDRRVVPANLRTPPRALAPTHRGAGSSRDAPSASSATASPGGGGCCTEAVSGAASGCCPNPGRNPSPTCRSSTMPPGDSPIHTPVSLPSGCPVQYNTNYR